MTAGLVDAEIAAFVAAWIEAFERNDAAAAAELRAPDYVATLPNGRRMTREHELAMIGSPAFSLTSTAVGEVSVRRRGRRARVAFDHSFEFDYEGRRLAGRYSCELVLVREEGRWRARRSGVAEHGAKDARSGPGLLRMLPRIVPARLRRSLRRALGGGDALRPQGYVAGAGGADFATPPAAQGSEPRSERELPVPPRALWLGYDYPAHGKAHVETMLRIVRESDFEFRPEDRILDLGCGAGRMIRHLAHLADTCEVWGADISADHVYWCKTHLSPPFRFLTNTTAPHLPFEDRSFRFIYGGSLFTHIDELADAWLLELLRLLAPDGRIYLTLHDRRTIELFDDWRYASSPIVKAIKAKPLFAKARQPFGQLVVGRDADPQVFYDLDWFARLAGGALEIVSATPEAYFYQTAVLMRRRPA